MDEKKNIPLKERLRGGRMLLIAYGVLLVIALVLIIAMATPDKTVKQKVGYITTGDIADPGWMATTFDGIRAAADNMGMELIIADNVHAGVGDCLDAVRRLASEGAKMIILSAPEYSQEMSPYFSEFSDIAFYGLYASALGYENLTGYSTRMYQARYLAGVIAGAETKTGTIGFVATTRTAEVCRGVNAFALGARSVNPDAEVVLILTDTVDDSARDRAAAEALINNEGVDVITHHQNQYAVIDAAEEAGIYSIGYYETPGNVSEHVLTCAACDWEYLYTELLREYMRGRSSHMVNDWLGLDSGVIRLTDYSPLTSERAKREAEAAKERILSGIDVFTGTIYDNEGALRCGEGEAITDETLTHEMYWLVEGVRVYG